MTVGTVFVSYDPILPDPEVVEIGGPVAEPQRLLQTHVAVYQKAVPA